MANKAPSFQFYPKDWLADKKVIILNYEEKGIYFEMLCHMWNDSENQCSIENNTEILRKILHISTKKTQKILKIFMQPGLELFKVEGNMLVSKRLSEEKEKQKQTSIKRQEAANKRWHSEQCKSNANALQKECLASSSSFASPSSIKILLKDKTYYTVPQEEIISLKEAYPKIDTIATLKIIAQWNKANPIKRKTLKGISKHINSWFMSAYKDQTKQSGPVNDGTTPWEPEKEPVPVCPEWQRILDKIEGKVESQESFDTWFLPTRLLSSDDKKVVIGVPNSLFPNWLRDHYSEVIRDALEGREYTFEVLPGIKA